MDFVANILTCRDGFCSRLSPRGSFSESRRNGIWALVHSQLSSRDRLNGNPLVMSVRDDYSSYEMVVPVSMHED